METKDLKKMEQMDIEKELLCEVHFSIGQEVKAIGVACALGPMSSAFCRECLTNHRVTYGNLVGYLSGVGKLKERSDLAPWVYPTLDATLQFYGKTWDEFIKDCNDIDI